MKNTQQTASKTDFVAFRLDADLHKTLKAQAKRLRVSKSFLMKQYLMKGMGRSDRQEGIEIQVRD